MLTSTHTLLGGKVTLAQPVNGYRSGMDAVMLAASVPAKAGDRVIDVGCGAGAVALCLSARVMDAHITGLDKNAEMVALARSNAALNNADRFDAVHANAGGKITALHQKFDHVMTNPPYGLADETVSSNDQKAWSSHESDIDLAGWLHFCFLLLKPKGTLTLIHRADRTGDIIASLHKDFGAVTLYPLFPYAGEPARRIIIRATKQSRAGAVILPGLVMHEKSVNEKDSMITDAANAILRDGAALF